MSVRSESMVGAVDARRSLPNLTIGLLYNVHHAAVNGEAVNSKYARQEPVGDVGVKQKTT